MASRLLTECFVHEFGKCLKRSTDVWIASAWVTQSDALDDLLTSGCRLKALVGTHGNATDPDTIQSLIDSDCDVRLVEGGALFHPKLYLFRRRGGKAVAWIGSANFTGAGLAGNREVILELDDENAISEMESWFDARWRVLRGQDVKAVLRDYRERRERIGVDPYLRSIVDTVPAKEGRQHLGDLQSRGTYRFDYFGEDRWAPSYAELARRVLLAFAEVDPDFLVNFAENDRKRVRADKRTKRRYVSRNRNDLGQPKELPKKALTADRRWWIAQKLADYHFFQGKTHPGILKMACATFGVTYGEGDAGPIDGGARKYSTGETVVVKIGRQAESHILR